MYKSDRIKDMKTILWVSLMAGLTLIACGADGHAPASVTGTASPEKNDTTSLPPFTHTMKLTITTGKDKLAATLYDNAAARDFMNLLPLTLTLEDYNQTEKISSLPTRLSTADVPSGYDPAEGDIAYYAPWGNVCFFYRDFGYSSGLVALGKIEGDGVRQLRGPGPVTVTLEKVK